MPNQKLDEASKEYADSLLSPGALTHWPEYDVSDLHAAFEAGAKWQKEHGGTIEYRVATLHRGANEPIYQNAPNKVWADDWMREEIKEYGEKYVSVWIETRTVTGWEKVQDAET